MQISVVIPLYNKKDGVGRALQSVFNQTQQADEIIVVNDGSTDGSEEIVAGLNHPLVRLVNQDNAGVSAARNKGIALAKGEWIAFLDADDVWKPTYLETIKFLHQTYPEVNVLATSYILQDYKGNNSKIILNKLPFKGEYGILSNYFEVAACSHPPLWTSAVVVSKGAIESVEGFPLGIKSGEDLITWAKLAINNIIAYSLIPLSTFILAEEHLLTSKPKREDDINDYVGDTLMKMISESRLKQKKQLKKYLSHWYKMKASVYLRSNKKRKLIKYSIKSLSYNIINFKVIVFILVSILPNKIIQKIIKLYTL